MISKNWKLATVLGVAGAIALSVASADARDARRGAAVSGDRYVEQPSNPYAYQPYPQSYSPFGAYAYQPSDRNLGQFDDGTGYSGSGTFSDGREVPGTNWNPNQN